MKKGTGKCEHGRPNRAEWHGMAGSAKGYSLMELLVTVAILLLTAVIALPLVQSASTSYQVRAAVNSVTGAIQTTRYQAISNGYLFRVAFNNTNSTYQIWNNPPNPSNSNCTNSTPCWVKVGGAVPLSGSSAATTLNQATTLDFHPSGLVQASTGSLSFTLTYKGTTENITVSNYGNVSVSP